MPVELDGRRARYQGELVLVLVVARTDDQEWAYILRGPGYFTR